jgi:predicted phosphodiesterase
MHIKVYTDCHVGSKYLELDIMPKTREQVMQENAFCCGDSHEIKNCEPKDLPHIQHLQLEHWKVFEGRFVTGNHSCDKGKMPRHQIILLPNGKKLMITHSDYQLWGEEKALKFRNEKPGQGSGLIQRAMSNWHGSVSKKETKILADYSKSFGADIVCIGHVHPKKIFDEMVDGVRVIVLPRGVTTMEV